MIKEKEKQQKKTLNETGWTGLFAFDIGDVQNERCTHWHICMMERQWMKYIQH